jgi:hypothetical protein
MKNYDVDTKNPVQELYDKVVHSAYLVELPSGELKTVVELDEIYKEMLEVKKYLSNESISYRKG